MRLTLRDLILNIEAWEQLAESLRVLLDLNEYGCCPNPWEVTLLIDEAVRVCDLSSLAEKINAHLKQMRQERVSVVRQLNNV